eukprot:CAMPEP_0198243742 /NCGR_PEP_ID=MMETSP1446-20131203/30544_1 /TAXON_ID=1461542 ORGANISM="Unidentified sp, Strain CCMP2111" /NCGR_SAMPLE_ID=MMETSP1446 /ASSEMBLY_ACC=CAM_ASM_001112 /LENGTH=42 /DNA_ID= /DNA_START= /DNA_END= /DNA_ORIENTATION=
MASTAVPPMSLQQRFSALVGCNFAFSFSADDLRVASMARIGE